MFKMVVSHVYYIHPNNENTKESGCGLGLELDQPLPKHDVNVKYNQLCVEGDTRNNPECKLHLGCAFSGEGKPFILSSIC